MIYRVKTIYIHTHNRQPTKIMKQERRPRITSSSQLIKQYMPAIFQWVTSRDQRMILSCASCRTNNCIVVVAKQIKFQLSPKSPFHHMPHPFGIKILEKITPISPIV